MKTTLLALVSLILGCVIGLYLTRREFAHDTLPIDVSLTSAAAAGTGSRPGKIGPKAVVVSGERHDFGSMDRNEHGTHVFIVRNDGDAPLTLKIGKTSCKCTVFSTTQDSVPPGQSAEVKLEWDVQTGDEQFEQSAELHTSDPRRPIVYLSVKGKVIDTVRADRSDIHFHDLSLNQTPSDSVNLYAFRDAAFKIEKIEFGNALIDKCFEVTHEPLTPAELAQQPGAVAGEKLTIALQPGLPIGPFQQTVVVTTNQTSPAAVHIQVSGNVVSDIVLAGGRINANNWTVYLGSVPRATGIKHTVYLRVKGPHRDQTQFRVEAIEPPGEFTATLGEPNTDLPRVVSFPLTLEIPPGATPVTRNSDEGFLRVRLSTTHPEAKEVTLKVRYVVN